MEKKIGQRSRFSFDEARAGKVGLVMVFLSVVAGLMDIKAGVTWALATFGLCTFFVGVVAVGAYYLRVRVE